MCYNCCKGKQCGVDRRRGGGGKVSDGGRKKKKGRDGKKE